MKSIQYILPERIMKSKLSVTKVPSQQVVVQFFGKLKTCTVFSSGVPMCYYGLQTFNPFNAEATFVQITRTQRFLKNI